MKKGIQKLVISTFGYRFVLLAFIFIIGPTVFIIKPARFGNMLRDFFHMATWLEPLVVLKVEKKRISHKRSYNILLVMVVSICAIYRFIYR
ncbi:hypothetical protein ACV566_04665 [Staphylococcus aureus]